MSEALLITLIGAAVVVVPLFISFRTTSFVEMKSVVAELKELIAKYEKDLGYVCSFAIFDFKNHGNINVSFLLVVK